MLAATKVLCRTCEDSKETMKTHLQQQSMKFPESSYLDLLKLVANLEINTNSSMPTCICSECVDKLENAYAFIRQAERCDQLWRNYAMNNALAGKCLDEVPIDMPIVDNLSHCLTEKPMSSLFKLNENLENLNFDGYQKSGNCDVTSSLMANQNQFSEAVNANDPITMEESRFFDFNAVDNNEDKYLKEETSETTNQHNDYLNYFQNQELSTEVQLPSLTNEATSQPTNSVQQPNKQELVAENELPKRKRGRPKLKDKQIIVNGGFECLECKEIFKTKTKLKVHHKNKHLKQKKDFNCSFCSKSFNKNCSLIKHQLEHHYGNDQIEAEWLFGDCLYSEKPFTLIKCRLCNDVFLKTKLLRNHLMEHGNGKNLEISNSSVPLKALNTNNNESIDWKVNEQDFEQFALIRNHFGYEMSLSDTDPNDSDFETADKSEYVCLICQDKCETKCKMFSHMRDNHRNETTVPFKCVRCSLSFSSERMFRQHLRAQCGNEAKVHNCPKCPGRFKWKDSLLTHQCPNRKKRKSFTTSPYNCDNCQLTFKSLTQLLQHQTKTPNCKDLMKNKIYNQNLLIKCALCSEQFASINDLTQHLVIHSDGETKCDPSKGIFYDIFYPNASLEQLKLISKQIANDFQQSNLLKFYLVADDEGFEYELNDIDIKHNEHKCGICSLEFPTLKAIMEHQNGSDHDILTEIWPYTCPKCNQTFVSEYLYERHRRRECNDLVLQKYQCDNCFQKFIWLENLEKHLTMKHLNKSNEYINPKEKLVHSSDSLVLCRKETRLSRISKYNAVDDKLCKPHGCKQIKCMICLSQHRKISDLRSHLLGHQYAIPWTNDQTPAINLQHLINQFYLYNAKDIKTLNDLINTVQLQIQARNLEGFYSITNEMGYELGLSSSETESDSDCDSISDETETSSHSYKCDLCGESFARKYLIYKHHSEAHGYNEAKHVCNHCQARFLCKELLQHHESTQCLSQLKRFICRKCPMRFMWEDNLRLHNQYHMNHENKQKTVVTNESAHKCNECNRSFVMLKDLTRHMVMHNSDVYTIKCFWCPRKFYRKKNLIMHVQRHDINADKFDYAISLMKFHYNSHGRKDIYCKICKVQFNRISTLRKHLQNESALARRTHHNYNSMLNYSITNQMGFELDINDSETDNDNDTNHDQNVNCKLYKCEICNLIFKRKYRLSLHQQSVHKYEKLPLKCDKCLFKTVSIDILNYHKDTHCYNKEKLHECPKCSYRFMWPENLTAHHNLIHQLEDPTNNAQALPTNNGSVKQVFHCDICQSKYNRKDRLAAHIKKVHSLNKTNRKQDLEANTEAKTFSHEPTAKNNSKKLSQTEKKSNQSYLCAFCGKAVTSSSNLIIHMRRHTGEKPFKCDFCDMAFPRSSDLQCHRRTHTGEKPHQCTICEKSFARSYKLHQHMRIHSGERPYKCTYCEKSFTQSNDLTLHVRRHTGERPYLCGVCGERFIQGTALKNHRLMRGHFE